MHNAERTARAICGATHSSATFRPAALCLLIWNPGLGAAVPMVLRIGINRSIYAHIDSQYTCLPHGQARRNPAGALRKLYTNVTPTPSVATQPQGTLGI
jgi:hypothetical protein